jgi:hypothetical protein
MPELCRDSSHIGPQFHLARLTTVQKRLEQLTLEIEELRREIVHLLKEGNQREWIGSLEHTRTNVALPRRRLDLRITPQPSLTLASRSSRSEPMRIHYERDDIYRRVVATVQGPFLPDDIRSVITRQRAEHAWTYGVLYDLRGMTNEPTVSDLQQLTREAGERPPGEGQHGPVALLVTNPGVYGRLCTYAALGSSTTLRIQVFRDRPEAEQWLMAHEEWRMSGKRR